jgi:hypothetical protein
MDSAHAGDMGRQTSLSGNINALKAWCSWKPDCLGFNTDGWMKNYIRPMNEWFIHNTPNQGFYVKVIPSPPPPPGEFSQGSVHVQKVVKVSGTWWPDLMGPMACFATL